MVVESVTASEVSGDSANVRVDDVVPAVMSDTVVSVAERRYINNSTMVLLQTSYKFLMNLERQNCIYYVDSIA